MKQATKIIIAEKEGVRLTISLDTCSEKQEGTITELAIQFYKRVSYLINKDYEFKRSIYEEEYLDNALDDELESEGIEVDDEEDYKYNEFKYK